MEHQPPVMKGHTPFFFDIHDGQVNSFFCCLVIGELHFGLGVFSDSAVEIFNGVGRVNDLSDL